MEFADKKIRLWLLDKGHGEKEFFRGVHHMVVNEIVRKEKLRGFPGVYKLHEIEETKDLVSLLK